MALQFLYKYYTCQRICVTLFSRVSSYNSFCRTSIRAVQSPIAPPWFGATRCQWHLQYISKTNDVVKANSLPYNASPGWSAKTPTIPGVKAQGKKKNTAYTVLNVRGGKNKSNRPWHYCQDKKIFMFFVRSSSKLCLWLFCQVCVELPTCHAQKW